MADPSPTRPNMLTDLLTGVSASPTPAAPSAAAAPPTIATTPDFAESFLPSGIAQPQPEYLIFEWIADSRVHRPRTREYYSSVAVIVMLVSLILFFAGQTLLIFVILAFLFITYVLASTKPISMLNQVTTFGIRYQGRLYYWNQLGRFWLRDNHGVPEIHIEAPNFFGNELILLESNAHSPVRVTSDDLVSILRLYLVNELPPMSQIDRWVHWLEEKFPLESGPKRS